MYDEAMNEGDVLAKMSRYVILRAKNDQIEIKVCEVIAGKALNRYVAIPDLYLTSGKPEFFGAGNSEKEALMDCLRRIRNHSFEEVFDRPRQQEH